MVDNGFQIFTLPLPNEDPKNLLYDLQTFRKSPVLARHLKVIMCPVSPFNIYNGRG